jgi:hypothetical protein
MKLYVFLVACCIAATAQTDAFSDEIPKSILDYFPGQWRVEGADGNTGTVEWKLVAGGKAVAGAGTSAEGGADHGMAGWQPRDKKWLHVWFRENGGYGELEVSRHEGDTYFGTQRVVDANGDVIESHFANRVIDKDHFEVTLESGDEKSISRWTRIKPNNDLWESYRDAVTGAWDVQSKILAAQQ